MATKESRSAKKELLGRGTQIAGIVTGDTELELEGSRLSAEGEAQERVCTAHREAAERASEAVSKR